jgi:hypothetical protein
MGKKTIKRRIEKILEDGPKDTLRIMDGLKKYRDCPTTNQLASTLAFYFSSIGETPSISLGTYHNVKVWTLRDSN